MGVILSNTVRFSHDSRSFLNLNDILNVKLNDFNILPEIALNIHHSLSIHCNLSVALWNKRLPANSDSMALFTKTIINITIVRVVVCFKIFKND